MLLSARIGHGNRRLEQRGAVVLLRWWCFYGSCKSRKIWGLPSL